MRKLMNNPRDVLSEMIEGLLDTQPELAQLAKKPVLLRADLPPAGQYDKVALISGGGSGHEPAHAGYIGHGMLDAVAIGDVFTAPSVDTVLAAIRAVAGPAGVLLIIKNYTGDRLNFGLAAELARAEGLKVQSVLVADDVALWQTVNANQRRGIAGTVLIHKIAGAMAASGAALDTIAQTAQRIANRLSTMGVSLGACTVPASGHAGFDLPEGQMELGLGIHGEAGVRRMPLQSADQVVDKLLSTIMTQSGYQQGEQLALLVNGLGATPAMELTIVARSALAWLRQRGWQVVRLWSGNFMTALEMPGCSLSLLPVDTGQLKWLDLPVSAPAWPGSGHIPAHRQQREITTSTEQLFNPQATPQITLKNAAMAVAQALIEAEPLLTELDNAAGDGDLGLSMQRGAEGIIELPDGAWADAVTALQAVSQAMRQKIGGSSGPFYSTALLRGAYILAKQQKQDAQAWAAAFTAAVNAIADLGGARPGDRTMLDALIPADNAFVQALQQGLPTQQAWQKAIEAAEQGAAQTAEMLPRLGRASYLGQRAIGVVDAGARAVVVWMRALLPFIR